MSAAAVPELADRVFDSKHGAEVALTTWNIFAESRHEPPIVSRLIWPTVAPLKNHKQKRRTRVLRLVRRHTEGFQDNREISVETPSVPPEN